MKLRELVEKLADVGISLDDELPQLSFTQWDEAGFEHEYSAHIDAVGTIVIEDDSKETVTVIQINCVQQEDPRGPRSPTWGSRED